MTVTLARGAISADAEWDERSGAGLSPSAAARESIRAAWDIPGEHGERERPPRCHAVGVTAHARAVTLDGLKKSMTSPPSLSAISRKLAHRWNEPRENATTTEKKIDKGRERERERASSGAR